MTVVERIKVADGLRRAVDLVVGDLIRVRHTAGESFVHIPIFYPSGAGATVSVTAQPDGYLVSDNGSAYQEAALLGAEDMFPPHAERIAEKYGVDIVNYRLTASTPPDRLAGAISNVAAASADAAHMTVNGLEDGCETEVADRLLQRLTEIFGADRVVSIPIFKGVSGREWNITALVRTPDGATAFKAVGTHAMSTYYAATALRDIALLSSAPRVVAVVRSIEAMGELYHILAQAGDVIEETAPDEAFRRAVGG